MTCRLRSTALPLATVLAALLVGACQDPAGPDVLSASFTMIGACAGASASPTVTISGSSLTVRHQITVTQQGYTFSSAGVLLPGGAPRALRVTTQGVRNGGGTTAAGCYAYSVQVPGLASGTYRMRVVHVLDGVASDSTSEQSITIP